MAPVPAPPQPVAEATTPAAADEAMADTVTPAPRNVQDLLAVTLEKTKGRSVLRLKTRGRIDRYQTLMLTDRPSRYVIDLPGTWKVAAGIERGMNLDLTKIDRIAIGEHKDHLRIAIHLRGGYLQYEPGIETTDDGLLIRLN